MKVIKLFSKPALVSLCRFLSHEKYLYPSRIRFASFRSKLDLWTDIKKHFDIELLGSKKKPIIILLVNHHTLKTCPVFRYEEKKWWIDDKLMKLPEPNRCLTAVIRRGPVTVTF
mgnify:CR=1 FL=1